MKRALYLILFALTGIVSCQEKTEENIFETDKQQLPDEKVKFSQGKKDLDEYKLNGKIATTTLVTLLYTIADETPTASDTLVSNFDEKGYLLESIYKGNGRYELLKIERDESYFILKKKRMSAADELMNQEEYSYDENGYVLELVYRNNNGEITSQQKNYYDEKGLCIKYETRYGNDTTNVRVTEQVYDEMDNLSELKQKSHGEIAYQAFYKYNSQNQLIEKKEKMGEHAIRTTFEYENDSKGNWIKRTAHENGNVVAISTRQIIYY